MCILLAMVLDQTQVKFSTTYNYNHFTTLWILSGTARVHEAVSEGKTNLDFRPTEARDNEWQWHQLRHMQICTSPQTDYRPYMHHPCSQYIQRMKFEHNFLHHELYIWSVRVRGFGASAESTVLVGGHGRAVVRDAAPRVSHTDQLPGAMML